MQMKKNNNFNKYFAVAVICLTIATVFFVGRRLVSDFEDKARYQSSQLEQQVQTGINFAYTMAEVSENHYDEDPQYVDETYYEFEYDSANDYYYLYLDDKDHLTSQSYISGSGQIPVSEEVVNELNLAMKYNDYFRIFFSNTNSVCAIYYLSESGFLSIYPYDRTEMKTFSEEFYNEVWYTCATPENNPERKPVWTSVYVDIFGNGLILTLSMPIYDGDEFKGVVSFDVLVGGIEKMFRTEQEHDTYLYDSNGNIIASDTPITENAEEIHTIDELGTEIESILKNTSIQTGEVEYVNSDFVYAISIDNTDWTYATILPASELVVEAFAKALPIVFLLVTLLFISVLNSKKKQEKLKLEAQNELLEVKVDERTRELKLTQEATIDSVTTLTEFRDNETGNHILRTKYFSKILAEALGKQEKYQKTITPDLVNKIYLSAPLHDIGKVGVKDEILLKPGRLTDEERNEMQKHTTIGYEALLKSKDKFGTNSFIDCALELTRYHHEKWDGTGYPDGLSGETIPLPARIMAVADVYDALTSKRVYKPAMPHEKAKGIIISDSGTHFDPDIVEAFVSISDEFAKISKEYEDDTSSEDQ